MICRRTARTALACACAVWAASASAAWQVDFCLKNPADSTNSTAVLQARDILRRTAESIGLVEANITVVPCDQADKAVSYSSDGSDGLRAGRYIIFNPVWMREVAGSDEVQSTAIFAHELGHFLNDDFGARKSIPPIEQEAAADRFAGCAVARRDAKWSSLEDLLTRLRAERSARYPSRLASLEAAKQGFEECGSGNGPLKITVAQNAIRPLEGYTFLTKPTVPPGFKEGPILPVGGRARIAIQATKADTISEIQKLSFRIQKIEVSDLRKYSYRVDPTKQPGFGGARPRQFNVRVAPGGNTELAFVDDSGKAKRVNPENMLDGTDFPLLRFDQTSGLQETLDVSVFLQASGLYKVSFVAHVVSGGGEYALETDPIYIARS